MTARSTLFSLTFVATVLALLALLAGCGDDDDSSASSGDLTTSSLDKKAYVIRAQGICTKGSTEALAYEEPTGAQLSPNELYEGAIRETIAPALNGVAVSIRELGAPSGDEAEVGAYVEALETDVDEMERQSGQVSSLPQIEKMFQKSGDLARSYGMESCAFG